MYVKDGCLYDIETTQDVDGNEIQIPKRIFPDRPETISDEECVDNQIAYLNSELSKYQEMKECFSGEKTLEQAKVEFASLKEIEEIK